MTTRSIDATYIVIGTLFVIVAASLGLFWHKETTSNALSGSVVAQLEPQAAPVQAKTVTAPKKSDPKPTSGETKPTQVLQNNTTTTNTPPKKASSGGGGGGSKSTPTPPPATIKKGDTLKIYLNVNSVRDLSGAQIDLNYDPQIVSLTSVDEGSFLDQGNPSDAIIVQPKTLSTASSGSINNLILLRIQPNGASGSGDVAILTFKGLTDGDPAVKLSNVLLSNSQAKPINTQLSLSSKIV
jgi:hypothetical protein